MEQEPQKIYTPYESADIIDMQLCEVIIGLPKLENLVDFFKVAADEENSQPWRKNSKDDFVKAIDDIRGGFIGTVIPESLELVNHGMLKDSASDMVINNAWIFKLNMQFMKISRNNLFVSGGIVVGSSNKRITIKAFDLTTNKFGKISYKEIEEYHARSVAAGVNSMGGMATRRIVRSDRTGSTS